MELKKKCKECKVDIKFTNKEVRKGIYKKKGEIFIGASNSGYSPLTLSESIFGRMSDMFVWTSHKYKLLEDVELKYVKCPICENKNWLNIPRVDMTVRGQGRDPDSMIGKYKVVKVGQKTYHD